MEWIDAFKKPFFIPSMLAGLIVAFRIGMLVFQYVQKKIQNRGRAERKKAKEKRPPTVKANSPESPPDSSLP